MIHSIDVQDPTCMPIEWWDKVPALAKPRRFDFKPGLNILWGKNGSGKTTVLKLLSRVFHCEQSGNPVMTTTSVGDLLDRWRHNDDIEKKALKAFKIDHDGKPVRHFDPSHSTGLVGGMAAFDWDFADEGIANACFKGSSGQTTMFRFDKMLTSIVQQEEPPKFVSKIGGLNDFWEQRVEIAKAMMVGSGEPGPPTILLDEPERSVDLPTQVGLWRVLRAYAPRTQFIVASHSFYALRIPEANYIEMDPGYLNASDRALGILLAWDKETPRPMPIPAKPKAEPPAVKIPAPKKGRKKA